ncbi:MAG: PAS domain-containing protein, partial [Spirochaetia bacterium]|nr:PAS domain-containing protein [Spirochaetia bacterium]
MPCIFNDFFQETFYATNNVELKNGMNALNDLPPEEVELWKSKYDSALSGEAIVFEFINAIDKLYEISLNPVFKNKKVTGVTALSVDITEQVKKQSLLEAFTNALPDISLIFDEDGKYIEVISAIDSLLIVKKEELIGSYIDDVLPKDIATEIHKAFRETIETGKPQKLEYSIFLQSEETWFQVRTSLMKKKINGKNTIAWISRDITKRKQAEQAIKQQLLEKEIILKESHHRIKNNFTSIGSLLSLQANSSDNPEVKSALNIAIGRVKGMTALYENLLLNDNYQTTSVKEYLNNLIDDIINLLSNMQNLTVEKQVDDIQLDSKKLFATGLIVNELLTNVMKYAFKGRDSGLIKSTLTEDAGEITLTIQDNGNGLPEGFDIDKQKGFGLMLIRMLSE